MIISPIKKERKNSISKTMLDNNIATKIRPIGNSNGIILSNSVLEKAGLTVNSIILLKVYKGQIIITEKKVESKINIDLSSWGNQFSEAIKKGKKSEKNIMADVNNNFDETEWI